MVWIYFGCLSKTSVSAQSLTLMVNELLLIVYGLRVDTCSKFMSQLGPVGGP